MDIDLSESTLIVLLNGLILSLIFNEKLLDDIKSCGYGGNLAPVLAAILSINSKKLDQPFHLQLVASVQQVQLYS